MTKPIPWATIAGLVVALLVPFAMYAVALLVIGPEITVTSSLVGLANHWIELAVLITIVLAWEHQSFASIGVKRLRWWTVPAGIVAALAIMLLAGVLVKTLGLQTDTRFAQSLQSLPFFLRVLLVLTAGIFEETLYRGYATERLTSLLGNKWLAGLCTVMCFVLAHVPAVGWSHILPVALVSILITLLYLWRRDLVLNMVAHSTIDALGLLLPHAGS